MYVWLRRGYGSFVRVKNETKARELATHWFKTGKGGGDGGTHHHVIGLFIGKTKFPHEATREQLYG